MSHLTTASGSLMRIAFQYAKANWDVAFIAGVLKIMLYNSYRSTDFEVHRNWLAVTYNEPPSKWYFEDTSNWSLDYPPLFAYFQWLLSFPAAMASTDLVKLSASPIDTLPVVVFQRLSVVAADSILFLGLCLYAAASSTSAAAAGSYRWRMVTWLVMCNAGLIIVDHIHFQYNGFLIGLLFGCMALLRAGRPVHAAVAYTLLVLTKHTFLYLAPAIGVWLLATHVAPAPTWADRTRRALQLAIASACSAFLALSPILWSDPVRIGRQVLGRLFPFGRGLVHTYWAPNAWAGYFTLDRIAYAGCRVLSSRGLAIGPMGPLCSTTSTLQGGAHGLMDTSMLHVLPTPSPLVCALLIMVAMTPLLTSVWRHGIRPSRLPHFCACAWLCAFLFGWHVHEKAGLYALLPLWLAVGEEDNWASSARLAWRASLPLHYCLAPLIFTPLEQPAVLTLLMGYAWLAWRMLEEEGSKREENGKGAWSRWQTWEGLYCAMLAIVHCVLLAGYAEVGPLNRLPFLPLLLTSDICLVGVLYVLVQSYRAVVAVDSISVPLPGSGTPDRAKQGSSDATPVRTPAPGATCITRVSSGARDSSETRSRPKARAGSRSRHAAK